MGKEFKEAKVEKIKGVVEPKAKEIRDAVSVRIAKMQQLLLAWCQSIWLLIQEKTAPTMAKVAVKTDKIKAQMVKALEPKIVALNQNSFFKKVVGVACKGLQITVSGCVKVFGKERTEAFISKVEKRIPAACKAEGTVAKEK